MCVITICQAINNLSDYFMQWNHKYSAAVVSVKEVRNSMGVSISLVKSITLAGCLAIKE